MAWLSASIPECAVTWGGQEMVSEGSTIAHFGMMRRVAIPTFMNRFGSVTTATGLTSEPVPDVVGIPITSTTGPGTVHCTVAGVTSSIDFPLQNPVQPTKGASNDGFVTRLDGSFDNVVGFPSEAFLALWPRFAASVES